MQQSFLNRGSFLNQDLSVLIHIFHFFTASSSRFTSDTDHTSVSRQNLRHRPKKRSNRKVPARLNRAGSMSSVTDSTMSEMVITVTLNMDTVNFLGISIVGQSNKDGQGDCGIYVG